MVLQRETQVPVGGWGVPGRTVSVLTSWNGRTETTRVASDGTWRVDMTTTEAGGPYVVTVWSGNDRIQFQDVLLG